MPPHHHGHPPPQHDDPSHLPPPKPHWSRMEQMSDDDVLRYAPPEIRRLWHKVSQVEERLATVQSQNEKILAHLERLEQPGSAKR